MLSISKLHLLQKSIDIHKRFDHFQKLYNQKIDAHSSGVHHHAADKDANHVSLVKAALFSKKFQKPIHKDIKLHNNVVHVRDHLASKDTNHVLPIKGVKKLCGIIPDFETSAVH